TDVYSLGIILFEMLTGKPPFESRATDPAIFWSEMRRLHESEPLPPLASFSVSPDLERIVRKAAAKKVEDRYATADEMLADLSGGQPEARLLVTTQPPGAEVFVDNLPRGLSNETSGRLTVERLTPGVHSVRVEMQAYNPYRIDVHLEAGNETSLQVALAARATVAIPPAQSTIPAHADTAVIATGDDLKTAVFVLEQLPPGSNVFIGNQTVGQADENGKATLLLAPGNHSVAVTSRQGATRTALITVANGDLGATKKITLPLPEPVASAPSRVTTSPRQRAKKPVLTVAAAAVVMITLLAIAYVVIKGPGRSSGETIEESRQLASSGNDNANSSASQTIPPVDPGRDSDVSNHNSRSANQNSNQSTVQKKEPAANANRHTAEPHPETAIDHPAVPPVVEPPVQSPNDQAPQDACINVIVLGPGGRPAAGVKVGCIEQVPGAAPILRRGKTGPRGHTALCGLKIGGTAKVAVLGAGDSPTGGTDVLVRQDKNPVILHVDEFGFRTQPGPDYRDPNRDQMRRRPPFMRKP
ncbi:MAG TPA: PEGA domain-containing protein, partial [Blastocatellia bacterium]|nr:PEGA domain-containing protein [Blastocatellia bacterium]